MRAAGRGPGVIDYVVIVIQEYKQFAYIKLRLRLIVICYL